MRLQWAIRDSITVTLLLWECRYAADIRYQANTYDSDITVLQHPLEINLLTDQNSVGISVDEN